MNLKKNENIAYGDIAFSTNSNFQRVILTPVVELN